MSLISVWCSRQAELTVASMLIAVLCGLYLPSFVDACQIFGIIFLKLLKLFALPLIAFTVIVTVGELGKNLKKLRTLLHHIISYMFFSEIIAVLLALFLFNLFTPGKSALIKLITTDTITNLPDSFNFLTFINELIPDNFFAALANFDIFAVVICCFAFGSCCAALGKRAEPILNGCAVLRDACSFGLSKVMLLAPLGIFALVGAGITTAKTEGSIMESFLALLAFVAVLIFGLSLHLAWQLTLAARLSKQPIKHLLHGSTELLTTAFATSSSIASLPLALTTAVKLKAHPEITKLMLPICASINVGGMMMYEVAAVLFFTQALGYQLSLAQQFLVAGISILGGMAEGGIPETSLISLVVVFKMTHIPLSAISFLLPLDRIIDRFRTMVNILGNVCGAITVGHLPATKKFSTKHD